MRNPGPKIKTLLAIALGLLTLYRGQMTKAQAPVEQNQTQPPAPAPSQAQPESTAPTKPLTKEDKNSFTINFKDVELEQIIKTFSDITGKNFILEQIPKGKITIVSPVKIPKGQALNVFQAILNLNGYNMVATSIPNLYRIIPIPEATKSNLPIYLPEQKAPAPAETYIIRFIPLKYLDAQEAANLIQPILSKESASVLAYQATNTLIIVDTALNISRINRVLTALDVPSLSPEMEIVYLHNSSASEISGTLSQIFSESQVGGKGTRAAPPAVPRPGQQARPAEPSVTSGSGSSALKIIPEQRLNALILIAQRDMLEQAKKIIALLDVQSGDKGVIHVYYCKNARAADLAGTLANLAGGAGGVQRISQPTRTSSAPSSFGGSAGVEGHGGGFAASGYGSTYGASAKTATGPSSATLTGGMFEGEIKISADEAINSLLIIASPRDYETLKSVIEKLDIPRRQVFVEAVLLELTIDQSRQISTSIHGGSPLPHDGVILGSSAPGGYNSMTLLSQLASGGVSLPSGLTVGAFGQNIEVPGTDGALTIPSAGYILNMLASDSNVNVLSTPTLLTMDNQEAEIQVGQNIPIPTGTTVSSGGLSSVSISRETVGIKLRLTPQICESGTIRMDIATETSNAVPSSLGVNVNTLGVTTSIKTAATTVIVKDAQTIVIGGLMEDRRSNSNSRFPFIGDIPVLGWLFKSAQTTKSKSNLIILITPHIVRSDEEIARMRAKFKSQYDSFIEESLGKEGKGWNDYFESQYQGTFTHTQGRTEETIDLTGPKARIIKENTEQPNSQPGDTTFPENVNPSPPESRQQKGATVNPLESATALMPEAGPGPAKLTPVQPEKKKHWWSLNRSKKPEPKKESPEQR